MSIMNGLEPSEWSQLRAIFASILPHITTTKSEMDLLLYLSDRTLRIRQVNLQSSVRDMLINDLESLDYIPIKHNYKRVSELLAHLIDTGRIIVTTQKYPIKSYTLNMVGILETFLKVVAYAGFDVSKYSNLLNAVKSVFPNNSRFFPNKLEGGMDVLTIEEAVKQGQAKRLLKIKSKQARDKPTTSDLLSYLDSTARNHSMVLYPLIGVKTRSILSRFIKDCNSIGISVYDVVDYLCQNYMKLHHYSQIDRSFNLTYDVLDFEKLYYHREEILAWYLFTKENGFDGVTRDQLMKVGDSLKSTVVPFKKRGRGSR